jgi:hypothetical protein
MAHTFASHLNNACKCQACMQGMELEFEPKFVTFLKKEKNHVHTVIMTAAEQMLHIYCQLLRHMSYFDLGFLTYILANPVLIK